MTSNLDLHRFWQDNQLALADPFALDIPQFPMACDLGYHCMFDELGIASDMWRVETDDAWVREMARAYNDKAEAIIGRRVLNENYDLSQQFPHVKSVGELFGCERLWHSESWWLKEAADTPEGLEKLLDHLDTMDVEASMFPDDWEKACQRIFDQHGLRPQLGRALRGPVTVATSIYGAENLIYLILDAPELAARFRDTLLRVVLAYYKICDRYSGRDPQQGGFRFFDDNCALLTPDMYAFFSQPILQKVFETFAPEPEDLRYQHSDSDMEHLLPLLAETGMNRVNFGPNVRFASIRPAMPKAIVEGTLAPFTLMRNDEPGIVSELRRDFDEARDTRGLVVATAGSVNDGTRLTSVRLMMQTIVEHGRFA